MMAFEKKKAKTYCSIMYNKIHKYRQLVFNRSHPSVLYQYSTLIVRQ